MSNPSRVRVTGPLEPYASGFRQELAGQGYRSNAAGSQLQLMAHASRWLVSRELGAGELTPVRVEEFLATRRAEGYTLWLSTKAMAPVVTYLRGLGVVPAPDPVEPATPAEGLLELYRAYRWTAGQRVNDALKALRSIADHLPAGEALARRRENRRPTS